MEENLILFYVYLKLTLLWTQIIQIHEYTVHTKLIGLVFIVMYLSKGCKAYLEQEWKTLH